MSRADTIIARLPNFYRSEDRLNNLYRFMEVFGAQLDLAEEDLIRVMRSHWVDTANNEDSKGFDTSEKGDLDKIFSLYVEALGGTSLLKQAGRRSGADGIEDDKIYRDRIKGLIRVLREGPSTRDGIISVVAANLGIVGDSEEAKAARQTIRIEEYLPEPYTPQDHSVDLFEEFWIENPNYVNVVPEIRVDILLSLIGSLVNPRIVNLETGATAQYMGVVLPGSRLSFLSNGTGLLDGLPIPLIGQTPIAEPRYSRWRFEAGYGMPAGLFDEGLYDYARFEEAQLVYPGRFDEPGSLFNEAVFTDGDPVVDVSFRMVQLTPGTFMVRIPWDIPGYTDQFEVLPDKPREQIPFIVDKVKAAGTFAVITYEKLFAEAHAMTEALTIQDYMPVEDQGLEELNFDVATVAIPYPGGLQHDLNDTLLLSGVFDYTGFDTLNTFA